MHLLEVLVALQELRPKGLSFAERLKRKEVLCITGEIQRTSEKKLHLNKALKTTLDFEQWISGRFSEDITIRESSIHGN